MRFPDVERIGYLCLECGIPLMACNPSTIGQCSECGTIWELPNPKAWKNPEIDYTPEMFSTSLKNRITRAGSIYPKMIEDLKKGDLIDPKKIELWMDVFGIRHLDMLFIMCLFGCPLDLNEFTMLVNERKNQEKRVQPLARNNEGVD